MISAKPSYSRLNRSALIALASLFLCNGFADSAPLDSGVYCTREGGGLSIYAEKIKPDGSLAFGVSVFFPNEHFISAFGVAQRSGKDRWVYMHDMQSPEDRCKINITHRPDSSVTLNADPSAPCRSNGGYGTEIRNVTFSKKTYEGPVTKELDGPEIFHRAETGKC